jgi:RNA polymerase sigma factor (sigma-70 family)
VETDFELLDRWQAGDADAGQALLARHFDSLCGFFESKCGQDADDLVQRTLLACVTTQRQFRRQSSFRTYLFAVARHELFHYLRSRHRDGGRLDFLTTSMAEIVTTPVSRLARDADRERVGEALRRLPVEQQVLLEMRYWQELEAEALAEILELTPNAIRVRLHRARAALRELLAIEDSPDDGKTLEALGKARPAARAAGAVRETS